MYLLDTNVVSELRRRKPHGRVVAWLETVAEFDLHLSAVTIGEIQAGIETVRGHDSDKATEIAKWLDQVIAAFDILPMDARAFRQWAQLMHGRSADLTEDAMIAATAQVHNLVVVTRNVRDFGVFEVRTLNPFGQPV